MVSALSTSSATVPLVTTRPACMTMTWEQVSSTSASRWLETTTVRPVDAYRCRIGRIAAIWGGSRPLVGSSSTSTSGIPSIAWAMPRRCFMPWL